MKFWNAKLSPCLGKRVSFQRNYAAALVGSVETNTLQSTLALRTPRYYGHPDNTDRTKSPEKINYRRLNEINSRYYGLSLLRPQTRELAVFGFINWRWFGHRKEMSRPFALRENEEVLMEGGWSKRPHSKLFPVAKLPLTWVSEKMVPRKKTNKNNGAGWKWHFPQEQWIVRDNSKPAPFKGAFRKPHFVKKFPQ